MSSYTGGRIVPKPCGAWSSKTAYERLSIVYNSSTGISYMAKKAVPAGTTLTNEDYWVISADYNQQYGTLSAQIAANVAASTDTDADYAAEVVDARVDVNGKTHASLGDSIRSLGAVGSLLNNWVSAWQVLNGQIAVTFSTNSDTVNIEVLKTSYLIRKVNGETYKLTTVSAASTELSFTPPANYWAIYWEDSTDDEGNDTSGWRAALTSTDWDSLFTSDHFVLAVMYNVQVFWATPVGSGIGSSLTINGVRYGNLSNELDALSETLDTAVEAGETIAAEVVDARVDDTGKEHTSLGESMRGIGAVRSFQNILDAWTKSYGYVNAEGSYVEGSSSSVWVCWRNIPVTGGKVLVSGRFGYLSGSDDYCNIWCFDKNGSSLGGVFRAESGVDYDHEEVQLLDDTAFISVTTGSTNTSGNYRSRVYLMPDLRTIPLLSTKATIWQCLNGQVDMTYSVSDGTVGVSVRRNSYLLLEYDLDSFTQKP